ncbi:MAG: PIN domain-containing protein [Chloroflexi bacterium]|nr:PIN domain-containing protein [Chloroflexota bacterium]
MPKPRLRVFLDSNVVFSGLYSPAGAPGVILEHFIRGKIGIVLSQQVLEDVIRTIKEKVPGALPALRRLLVSTTPEIVADPAPEEIDRLASRLSIGDATVLGAMMAAKPDYFVTGDNHFLENPEIAAEADIRIVTPAQLLKLVGYE